MKKILFLLLLCFIAFSVNAQDDAESVVFSDIEVEGFETLWIQSSIKCIDADSVYSDFARPQCGKTRFMYSVQKTMQKLFRVIANKYPDELLAMYGTNNQVFIDFLVNEDGDAVLQSITNGATFGIDQKIAQKILNSCKKWVPAKINNTVSRSKVRLQIDISL